MRKWRKKDKFICHRSGSRSERKMKFTLIELLITIAIIVLLIAILLPALVKAREKARDINCLSNLKMMSTAARGYLNDSADMWWGYLFEFSPKDTNVFWYVPIGFYAGVLREMDAGTTSQSSWYIMKVRQQWNIFRCPSDTTLTADGKTLPNYGVNASCGLDPETGVKTGIDYRKMTKVKLPSQVCMFADAYGNAWSANMNTPATFRGKLYASGLGQEEVFPKFARHGNGINAALVDGHVERISPARLQQFISKSSLPFFDTNQIH